MCEERIRKVNQFHLSEKVSYSNSYFCNFAILYILCSCQKSLIFFFIGSKILHINLLACKSGAHAVRIRIGDFYLLVNGRVIPAGCLKQCPQSVGGLGSGFEETITSKCWSSCSQTSEESLKAEIWGLVYSE